MKNILRPLALYLPQFHPIPENDEWWGKGFTEWTNVAAAKPRYKGHYQPHIPADLGFYDLRLPETQRAQADLARQYGIHGFCYYHYWFNGKTLLERPIETMLKSGDPDFPFCMCWANENWSRNWDGKFSDVLLEQHYSHEDDLNHIRHLLTYFADSRYIRVDGKPVFIVYRTELFPDILMTTEIWREEAIKSGVGDLYLIRVESFVNNVDPQSIGFDAAFEFQPNWKNQPPRLSGSIWSQLLHYTGIKKSVYLSNRIRNYADFVNYQINNGSSPDYKRFPGVSPMWDNTARRKTDAYILRNSSPEEYGRWLKYVVDNIKPYSPDENFVFINAWNEWAEGNHLEPCQKWELHYLEVTARVLKSQEEQNMT